MASLQSAPRITPFLWFDANAEEAVDYYVSIFPGSRKLSGFRREIDDPSGLKGTILTVGFELCGLPFTALNGGPHHKFTDAISFVVHCKDQEEIDHYWARLTEGGAEVACGWLRDKFGLSWQVVPENLTNLLNKPAAMQALMQMVKLDIAALERAGRS